MGLNIMDILIIMAHGRVQRTKEELQLKVKMLQTSIIFIQWVMEYLKGIHGHGKDISTLMYQDITISIQILMAAFDKDLSRVGVIAGASIYPFVWNILLAARNEGLGGVLTTFLSHQEDQAKSLLGIPNDHAIAALVGLGEPVRQLTKLTRKPVSDFAVIDHFQGARFEVS